MRAPSNDEMQLNSTGASGGAPQLNSVFDGQKFK
jgi:hypothetical protein